MKDFYISISSHQEYGKDCDNYQFSTDCSYEMKNKEKIITYKEPKDSPVGEGTTSIITIYGDGSVSVKRANNLEDPLIFKLNLEKKCNFNTVYGNFRITIFTKEMHVKAEKDFAAIFIKYDIILDGNKLSTSTLNIKLVSKSSVNL